MDTLTQVRTDLHARKGDWPAICLATGLSYWWLIKFAQGRIREPGLTKVERLQNYLAANDPAEPVPGNAADDLSDADPDAGRIDPDVEGA